MKRKVTSVNNKMATPMWYHFIRSSIFTLIIVGVATCVYAYYVETSKEADKNFVAACDISPTMSCSKVFTSRYGRGFGLLEYIVGRSSVLNQPNSIFGLIFYLILTVLTMINSVSACKAQVALCFISNLGSVYLGYILYFVLKDICIVCVSMYVINFLLLIASISRLLYFQGMIERRRRKKVQ